LQATMLAMSRAVAALPVRPMLVLVDGNRLPRWAYRAQAIVKGDAKSLSIAAASIIAKETRDQIMGEADAAWPGYGWADNMGYGTRGHLAALNKLGPTPLHRKTFAPVARLLTTTG
jgi:ribonuclease HII